MHAEVSKAKSEPSFATDMKALQVEQQLLQAKKDSAVLQNAISERVWCHLVLTFLGP